MVEKEEIKVSLMNVSDCFCHINTKHCCKVVPLSFRFSCLYY